MKKSTFIVSVAVALLVGGIVGYLLSNDSSVGTLASPVGTTFNNAKVAAITAIPLTVTATSTSVYNSDSNNRFIESGFAYCTGVGGNNAALNLIAATTSTNAPATTTNTSYALNISIATTTTVTSNASSTYGNPIFQLWPSGSYLSFFFSATNTAACTIGVHYLAS